jgi:hypothetical protein
VEAGRGNSTAIMDSRSQMLIIVLLLSLMGMGTVVMGRTVESQLKVPTPKVDHGRRQQIAHPQPASSSTACDDQYPVPQDLLDQFLPCVPAVFIVSTPSTAQCCGQLQAKGLTCLCSLFVRYRSRIPRGLVSMPKVRQLPRQCGLPVPEGTVCDGASP